MVIGNSTSDPYGGVSSLDVRYFDSDDMFPDTYNQLFTVSTQLKELKGALHINKAHFTAYYSWVEPNLLDRLENTAWVFDEIMA